MLFGTLRNQDSNMVKETLRMAWPAVLESFFISLAGMIDTMMVSTLGTYAVASVGLTTQPKFISLALFFSTNIAVSALIARRRGQQNRRNANEIFLTALLFTILMAGVITYVSIQFASPIITWCGSNVDTHDPAVLYFNIIQGGMIFNVLSMVINAAQRGSGNTRIAMTTNTISSIVNVIFNYLLINGHLGFPALQLQGAAIATVLGTVFASALSFRSLFKKNSYISIPYIIKETIRPRIDSLSSILRLSSNFLLENLAMRIGFVMTAIIAARLGTNEFAAHQVGMNVLGLAFAFGDGMQVAAVALIGRSLGEKNPEKAITYGKICQQIGLLISLVLSTLLFLGARPFFGLFFKEKVVVDMGVLISWYIIITIICQVSAVIYGGSLRGAGDVKYTLFASLISCTLVRSLVTYLFTGPLLNLGLHGIWLGVFADQFVRFLLLSTRFQKGEWTKYQM
ncbi:MAG: MATE family efflux transporter [Solobacterium sp.]|nr:MATE family efflux transporter [Solobacterium sp.]